MTDSSSKPLAGRVALVTGASRGIGRASALALAAAGAHVIACAKTQGGLEELDDDIRKAGGEGATLVPFDLTDASALDRLGGAVYERWGKLDIIVHAGGMLGGLSPVSHFDVRQWAKVMAVNLTSVYRMIRSFEPLLKQSDAARAVFFTSNAAERPRAFWGPYAASKAGMEALVRSWGDEVENTSIRVAVINPDKMATRMRAEAYPGEDPEKLPDPSEIGPLIVELVAPGRIPPKETVNFKDWKAGLSAEALV
ncbi:SDR family NAD(P)-dependent oxidoreductase [Caulobacter sp. 17J65-9]|uniref:SDR family NAD(P)-dependent oxidoreductase n=1 Tax=Caulobacter sp. 17J65-9 TaxID=2709382 RepID=UPI0013CAC52C|nr:SDR family NAD(P)-dependent oxidoreductase [Caulobacter sp. 17J65-9]NEX91287.1 SDR family NAD(P)-dependent oxidoreductase [Caulobacter sp. 17J65-9]